MSDAVKETRRHRRFHVDVEAVVHVADGRQLTARTRDLSRSGICLITNEALPGNEPVIIELVLAFGRNAFSEPLVLDGRVVWCTPIGAAFQVGTMFDELSAEHSEFLDMFLRYLDGTLAPQVTAGEEEGEETEETDTEAPVPPDVKDDPFRH